jgi:hypothetical protein
MILTRYGNSLALKSIDNDYDKVAIDARMRGVSLICSEF